MKKKIVALLALSVLSMSSVYAAETQGPISRWLDQKTSHVAKKEQDANAKIAAKQKARQEKLAKQRAKAQMKQKKAAQKRAERQRKQKERKARVEAKKKHLRELFK